MPRFTPDRSRRSTHIDDLYDGIRGIGERSGPNGRGGNRFDSPRRPVPPAPGYTNGHIPDGYDLPDAYGGMSAPELNDDFGGAETGGFGFADGNYAPYPPYPRGDYDEYGYEERRRLYDDRHAPAYQRGGRPQPEKPYAPGWRQRPAAALRAVRNCRRRIVSRAKNRPLAQTVAIMSVIVLLLAASFFIFYAVRYSGALEACALTGCGRANSGSVMLANGQTLSLNFLKNEVTIAAGEDVFVDLDISPVNYEGSVTWTSSDPSAAAVGNDGVIHGIDGGSAVIIARCDGAWASVNVTVEGDILTTAGRALRKLAAANGAEEIEAAAETVENIYHDLSSCSGNKQKRMAELLGAVLAFRENGAEPADARWARLEDAAEHFEDSRSDARSAALLCACMRENKLAAGGGTLTFTGDVTLARYNENGGARRFPSVYAASGSYTYPFDGVRAIFACDDMTVVNFEGTLTDSTAHKDKTFYFRGDPEYAKILPAASVEAANLGNNHAGDYLEQGYLDTVMHLKNAGVQCIEQSEPMRFELGGVPAAMVTLVWAEAEAAPKSVIEKAIRATEECTAEGRTVIVIAHWGGEAKAEPEQWRREAARELIDAGAKAIIGHHPHVVQGVETYNGADIYYSIGNFAFGGNASVSSPEAMMVRVRIGGTGKVETSAIACLSTSSGGTTNNYRPKVCFGKDAERVKKLAEARSEKLQSPKKIEWLN